MSQNEFENEQPNKIVNIIKTILDFYTQFQTGQRLKILTPDQILSRLPLTSAQMQAGKSSEKLKNEIQLLLFSLYRSKTLTKVIYKHLIKII